MSRSIATPVTELLGPILARPEARSDLSLFVAAATTIADSTRGAVLSEQLRLIAEVIELGRQVGDPRLLVDALSTCCGLYFFAGEPEHGLAAGAEAVEVARLCGDDVLLGSSIMSYLLCLEPVDPDAAAPLYAEGIACTQRSGDRLMAYLLHNNASVHALRAGDFAAARAHLQQAAEAGAEIGEENHVVPVNMGWVLRYEHDPDGARGMFASGLRMSRRTGDSVGVAYSSLGLAIIAGDLGDWYRAAELHGFAHGSLERLRGRWQSPEGQYRQESIDVVREHLGAARFDETYARGTVLTLEDAMDLALTAPADAA
jgi:hypothetical protein